MILEVKKFPESQEVMDDPEWFFIMDADPNDNKLGSSSYARIITEEELKKLPIFLQIQAGLKEEEE